VEAAPDVSGACSWDTPNAMVCTKHSHKRSPDVSGAPGMCPVKHRMGAPDRGSREVAEKVGGADKASDMSGVHQTSPQTATVSHGRVSASGKAER
jgi:hypothetical protein